VFCVVDASGNWSSMATEITLARIVQAGAMPIDTVAVLSEIMGTWNRPDAMEYAAIMTSLMPGYQLLIESYNKTPRSTRKWCKLCGGHLFTEHPHWELTDVYAATIPDFPFKPGLHVHYQESVLHVRDGLPKMRDVPKEMGGSGETLPE
jgi:hypothetical protein